MVTDSRSAGDVEAGRRLDEDVAEKVMGWTVQLIVGPRDIGTFEEWRDEKGWRYGPNPPPYSTDIAAAWLVWEKLDEPKRLHYELYDPYSEDSVPEGDYTCFTGGYSYGPLTDCGVMQGGPGAVATAATAPEAICRAALLAVSARASACSPPS